MLCTCTCGHASDDPPTRSGGNAWKGKPIRNLTIAVLLLTLLTVVTAFTVVTRPDTPGVVRIGTAAYATAERCPTAQKAIGFYRQKYRAHREAMSLPGPVPRVWYPCDAARRRAVEWKQKAAKAAAAVDAWLAYHHDWWEWLPDKWQRIGACETGYGKRPGNWRHWNTGYEGAFGFAHSSWDAFVRSADPKAGPYPASAAQATPRQQYEVALAIYRRYGLTGWGCRGA